MDLYDFVCNVKPNEYAVLNFTTPPQFGAFSVGLPSPAHSRVLQNPPMLVS